MWLCFKDHITPTVFHSEKFMIPIIGVFCICFNPACRTEQNAYYWRNVAYLVTHEESWCDLKGLFSAVMVAISFVTFWRRLRKYRSSICFSVLGILLTAITHTHIFHYPWVVFRHTVFTCTSSPHYWFREGNLLRKQRKTVLCRATAQWVMGKLCKDLRCLSWGSSPWKYSTDIGPKT